ncbi:MAG: recombinase family protein [Lachnospiraceae bacterium]|nr:recombinase family protein [Lachnospiraceae bacterium]
MAVYCRVSTASDLQDGSFEVQKEYYKKKIQSDPTLILADVYGDQGKSGRSIKARTEFQRMMQDCEEGRIDLILTKSISRFSRNLAECVESIRRLQELQIPILFEKEAINTADERNELFLCILATVAQSESDNLASHINWSRKERALAGRPYGNVSYGYRAGKPDHVWHVEESEAERVRLAFEMADKGCCYMEIREALQKLEDEECTGKVWSQYNLGYLLRNIYYTGDYVTNKTCDIETAAGRTRVVNEGQKEQYYIEEHHEPFVSMETFERVQMLIERHLLFSNKYNHSEADRRLLET